MKISYVLQAGSVVLMILSVLLFYFSIYNERYVWAVINFFLFTTNLWLFIWQGYLRRTYGV